MAGAGDAATTVGRSEALDADRKIGLIGACCASTGAPVKLTAISIAMAAERPILSPLSCSVLAEASAHFGPVVNASSRASIFRQR
jgi:hypothetical protein